jgi:acetolactate synthase-1/2/3 large subunit
MEEVGIPVVTTQMGKGLVDEIHPISIGNVGYFMGNNSMTKFHCPIIQRADVVLLVGTRTNQNAIARACGVNGVRV